MAPKNSNEISPQPPYRRSETDLASRQTLAASFLQLRQTRRVSGGLGPATGWLDAMSKGSEAPKSASYGTFSEKTTLATSRAQKFSRSGHFWRPPEIVPDRQKRPLRKKWPFLGSGWLDEIVHSISKLFGGCASSFKRR